METKTAANIDAYIATFPKDVQVLLEQIRKTIKTVAPKAEETISYAIPAFKLNDKAFIYFAGFKKHVSVYPAPTSNPDFEKAFAKYKTSKGTVQFPIDQPIPHALITRIAKFRMKENQELAKGKTPAKKK